MLSITRLAWHRHIRRLRKPAVLLLTFCAAGLLWITGCGSGTSSSGSGSGTSTPSSNGLTVYPATASVPVSGQVDFTGYVPSQPGSTITWAVSGSSTGSISSSGVYTAPSSVPSPAQVSVTATSGGFSATAIVTVTSAQGVSVSPAAASIPAGSQTTFTATVNGAAATGVTWEVNGTAGGDDVHGTIDANGNYIAPLSPPPGGSTVISAVVGGSSGNSTATIIFSNASLNGNYAFSYTGDDGSGLLGIIGEFTANGSGTISGTEDFLDAQNGPQLGQLMSGTYSIGPDGRGTVDLTSSTGEVWQIAIASNQHALLINLNSGATGSGTIDQQTSTSVLATGPYVFQLSGLDTNGFVVGVAGAFTSLGNGLLASDGNVMDINDAGTATTDITSLTGSFSTTGITFASDSFSTVTGANNTTVTFAYFPVTNGHLHLLEVDGNAFMAGDVFAGTTAPAGGYNATLVPAGDYAFTMGGATQSPYAAGGVFISNGGTGGTSTSGSITGGVFDNNNGGVHFQSDTPLKSTSYTVDQNTGRVTGSFTTAAGTFDWVGYVTAPLDTSQADSSEILMLESDSNATASGTAFQQSSTSQPSGTFAFNLSGQAAGNTPGEQDILAQLAISGTVLSGTMDINNFSTGAIVTGLNIQSSKSTIASPDGNGRGTMTVVAADGASFPLAYYVVNSGQVLFIETDNQRVMLGTILKQF